MSFLAVTSGGAQVPAPAASGEPGVPGGEATAQPGAPTPPPAPTAGPATGPSPAAAPSVVPYVVPTSAPFSRFDLDADSIDFYWNRYIIEANGHVRVAMNDGTVVTGDTFTCDLRMNRFMVAGHVHLAAKDAQYDGAAFSSFMDLSRSYFLPVFNQPDRWTFFSNNFALPYLGRAIPGDAFVFPDLSHDRVFLNASSAVVWPRDAMLFRGTKVHVVGLNAPGGNIYLNFSPNLNFHQNSLTGAVADIGYPFAGGRYWYSTLHLRYDHVVGPYLGFEQHFAWDNAFIVASANPFDRAQKQYNLLASDRISPAMQFDTFQQINVDQYGWTAPNLATYFGSYSGTVALNNSFAKLTYNVWNYGLAPGLSVGGDPDHPTNTTLQWNGFPHRLKNLPLTFQLRSGIMNADDTYGVGTFIDTIFTNLWSTFVGGTLYTDSIKLFNNTYFTASYDRQRTFFSLPHYVDTQTTTASISRLIGLKAAFSVTYQNVNSGDYAGRFQSQLYPPQTVLDPVTGLPVLGYEAFNGFTTSRTMSYLFSYTPQPTLSASINYQHYTDFPRPIGLLVGRPPNYLNLDVKMRLTPQLSLELGRAYYFNWYGAKWAPQMLIQFGP